MLCLNGNSSEIRVENIADIIANYLYVNRVGGYVAGILKTFNRELWVESLSLCKQLYNMNCH